MMGKKRNDFGTATRALLGVRPSTTILHDDFMKNYRRISSSFVLSQGLGLVTLRSIPSRVVGEVKILLLISRKGRGSVSHDPFRTPIGASL